MNLIQRLRALVQVAINDVLGEELAPESRSSPSESAGQHLEALLQQAQADLDTLRLKLAEALDRQKRIAQNFHEAAAKAQSFEDAVNAALVAGHDAQAANLLQKAQKAHAYEQDLDNLRCANEQLAGEIRVAVESRQEQLAQMRGRLQTLAVREQAAEALENLLQTQRDLERQSDSLQAGFLASEEQIARREDRLAARQEWSR
jgi:phage shock protein A